MTDESGPERLADQPIPEGLDNPLGYRTWGEFAASVKAMNEAAEDIDVRDPAMVLLGEYAALTKEKAELNAALNGVVRRMGELEPTVLDYFAQHGVNQVRVEGVTLYPLRQQFARMKPEVDRDSASAALRDAGLGDYVSETFNLNSISAFFREAERNGEDLHPAVHAAFDVIDKWRVGARTS